MCNTYDDCIHNDKYTQIIITPAKVALWLEGLRNMCSWLNLTGLN